MIDAAPHFLYTRLHLPARRCIRLPCSRRTRHHASLHYPSFRALHRRRCGRRL